VLVAGLEVPERLVVELAQWLRAQGLDDTAETLESAYAAERDIASLDDEDREAILLALADCPYGLSELRTVVLLQNALRPLAAVG
jgi:hypothetical protein